MQLKLLTAYKVTKGNTDGSIDVNDIIWLSENGTLNVSDASLNYENCGFFSAGELTPEITDFEATPHSEYQVVKLCHSEVLMRSATLAERESVRNYRDSISERVVPVSRVKKYLEEIEDEFKELLESLKESHDWGRVYGVEMTLNIIKNRIKDVEQEV